jgi:acyl dehydratase
MRERFASAQEFQAAVGRAYGPMGWMLIERARINAFADATDDHQWIHVDTARAASGPFGGTIAHGFPTLALAYHFPRQLIEARRRSYASSMAAIACVFPRSCVPARRCRPAPVPGFWPPGKSVAGPYR